MDAEVAVTLLAAAPTPIAAPRRTKRFDVRRVAKLRSVVSRVIEPGVLTLGAPLAICPQCRSEFRPASACHRYAAFG